MTGNCLTVSKRQMQVLGLNMTLTANKRLRQRELERVLKSHRDNKCRTRLGNGGKALSYVEILQAEDLSKKGSIDEPIRDLIDYINDLDDYVTTSSCSGRAILYSPSLDCVIGHKKSKKAGKWLYTSHDLIDPDDFVNYVNPMDGDLLFKFEPFILHVQCSNLEKAKKLHTIALGAGFRDSGLTIGKHGKIILAIRSNLRLELPLSQDNVMLVSDSYLKFLAGHTNEKMERNQRNIKHFFIVLKETLGDNKKTAVEGKE